MSKAKQNMVTISFVPTLRSSSKGDKVVIGLPQRGTGANSQGNVETPEGVDFYGSFCRRITGEDLKDVAFLEDVCKKRTTHLFKENCEAQKGQGKEKNTVAEHAYASAVEEVTAFFKLTPEQVVKNVPNITAILSKVQGKKSASIAW